jgi:hypothetical protein
VRIAATVNAVAAVLDAETAVPKEAAGIAA